LTPSDPFFLLLKVPHERVIVDMEGRRIVKIKLETTQTR